MNETHAPSPYDNDLLTALQEANHLTTEQIDQVRRRMKHAQCDAVQSITDLGLLSPETLYRTLAEVANIPFVSLAQETPQQAALEKIPAKVALRFQFVPLSLDRGIMRAAFATVLPLRERENLRMALGVRIDPVLATPKELDTALKRAFGLGAGQVMQLAQNRTGDAAAEALTDTEQEDVSIIDDLTDASIVKLVNEIIGDAVRMHTTDIHIEPFRDQIRLRYRIDGMLRDIPTPPGMAQLQEAIISRIKIMAKCNIAEKRLPHDGRIRLVNNGETLDLRVSIMPTRFGETICLRVLATKSIFISLEKLGLNHLHNLILTKLISLPHGIVLVTGPTGSGKTTTLYASLAFLKSTYPERKIITVENPVEYELPGTSQIQMHAEIGLTFAVALRAILRHDPDVILVGEIRDNETADIAIQSALTGHLVLSTLHTNDSVGAVNRLVNMGVEAYLVASSLVASIAQRLVRRICPHCKEEDTELSNRSRMEIAETLGIKPEEVHAWKGKGCPECDYTGYRGRVAIYEFFLLDEHLQDMVAAQAGTSELRNTAIARGMKTLRQNGWEKVSQGATTAEEINRITSTCQISYKEEDLVD